MIGGPDDVEVVLHGDDGVAFRREPADEVDELRGVAGMEPERRLVQDERDPGELDAEQRGQPEPLGFPSRKRGRGAVEAEVAQPDVADEAETARDLPADGRRHGRGPSIRRRAAGRVGEERQTLRRGQGGERGDVEPPVGHGEGRRLEPAAAAIRAGIVPHQDAHRLAAVVGVFALVFPGDEGGEPFPRPAELEIPGPVAPFVGPDDVVDAVPRPVEGDLPFRICEVRERLGEVHPGRVAGRLERGDELAVGIAVETSLSSSRPWPRR